MSMRSILAAASAATLLVGVATYAYSQTPATPGAPQAAGKSGANVGSLSCNVAGSIARGALAGNYAGATASATVGVGAGANVLIGGSSQQVTLQPVSVEGSV